MRVSTLLYAFLRRDLAIERSYRFHLLIQSFDIAFQLGIFYFIARLIPGVDYFSFVLVGLMFGKFFQFWLTVFVQNVRQEQYWGTMESLFLSPARPLALVASGAGGKVLLLAVELLAYILFGTLLFGARLSAVSLLGLLPYVILSAAFFAGLGLIAASFILYFKRGDPVTWLASTSLDLVSGVYFPVTLLPGPLPSFAFLLPTTMMLNAWRRALTLGERLSFGGEFIILLIWTAAVLLIAAATFKVAYDRTRIRGELGTY